MASAASAWIVMKNVQLNTMIKTIIITASGAMFPAAKIKAIIPTIPETKRWAQSL